MKEKKDNSKDMLFEMMHKVSGMPLNENYPAGADEDPNAPWNEPDEDEEIYEPDPDEYRDDDLSENNQYSQWNILSPLTKNENFTREDLKLILNTIYDKVYLEDKQKILELQRIFSMADE